MYLTGCRNVSHCQQQQSYSGLRSPRRSNTTYFWLTFCYPAISQFLMADMSFNIACKELKIAQLNQLFQFLHLVYDIRRRLLWVKSYTKEEKCKQWRQQRFSFIERFYSNDFMGREGKAIISSISFPASLWASTLLCQLSEFFYNLFFNLPTHLLVCSIRWK